MHEPRVDATGPPPGPFGGQGGQPPPAGGFGAPQGGGWNANPNPPFGGPPGGFQQPVPSVSDPINPTPAVVLGVIAMMCACLPGGVAAIVLAMMAKDQERRGDVQGARSKLTYSYVASIGSLVIAVPLIALYVFLEVALRM